MSSDQLYVCPHCSAGWRGSLELRPNECPACEHEVEWILVKVS